MIRTDLTSRNAAVKERQKTVDARIGAYSNDDDVLQSQLTSVWEKRAEKANSGLMRAHELRELEIQRRLSAVTENRTPEIQRKEHAQALRRIDRAREAIMPERGGQSEEEYKQELEALNRKYQKALHE